MNNTELINKIIELQSESNRVMGSFAVEPWIELGLTIAQLKSLFFIVDKEKTNFKRLAEALGVTPPNITGIVDRLVEQGLVSRTENPDDRRIMVLQATEKGRELLNRLNQKRYDQMVQILGHISAEELNALVTGYTALVKAARAYMLKEKEAKAAAG